MNLSQRDKLSPDLSFYFKDPSVLCQKILEVCHFQKIHRSRRYDGEMRKRLIKEIVIARQIRARSESYLPFINKFYEVLYAKYGVKPLVQRCEFSPAEVEDFIGEVAKVRQQLGRGRGGEQRSFAGEVADQDAMLMDMEQRTPAPSPMCTPRQSPMSVRASATRPCSISGGRSGGQGSSLFRAHVQSEMRSGERSSSGGNPSQLTTPTGSMCNKPSPLLSGKRALQQPPPPRPQWDIPSTEHINLTHLSNQQTPSDIFTARNQIHLLSASQKKIPNCPIGSAGLRIGDRMSITPMSVRHSSNAAKVSEGGLPVDSRSSLCNLGSLLAGGGVETHVGSKGGNIRARLTTENPGSVRSHSTDPRSYLVSSTPGSMQEVRASPMAAGVAPASSGSVRRISNFPGSRLSCASGSSLPSATSPSSSDRQGASTPVGSRICVPANFGSSRMLYGPLPVPSSTGQVPSNSVQRKPLSGMFLIHVSGWTIVGPRWTSGAVENPNYDLPVESQCHLILSLVLNP